MPRVVKRNSAGSRFFSSFGSLIMGFILILICIVGLFWNESRSVTMTRALDDVQNVLVDISSAEIKSENDGKLVAVSGNISFSTPASDGLYAVNSTGFVLIRIVEVYLWEETRSGSSTDEQIVYEYNKVWSNKPISSSGFYDTSYSNPSWPSGSEFQADINYSADAKLGVFNLSPALIDTLPQTAYVGLNIPASATLPATGFNISSDSKYITNSQSSPQVGDVRVSFVQCKIEKASILAKQQGADLIEYTTFNNVKICRMFEGTMTGQEMAQWMQDENNTITWVLRFVFTILMCLGFASLFAPIEVLSSIIPLLGRFLGSLTRAIIGVIALVAGLALSLIVIAIAWIVVRPLIAIPLLIAAVGLIVLVIVTAKKKKAQQQQ